MPSKSLRLVTAVAAFLAVAVSSAACGDDEEADVHETVELFLAADDPRRCDVRTDRFLRNSENEANLAIARRNCRENDSEDEPIKPPEGGEVSDVDVDGDRANATVTLEGGYLDGHKVSVELENQGGRWKVDLLDGIVIDDRLRRRFEQVFREGLSGGSIETSAQASQVECILERLREFLPDERLADRLEGRQAPGAFNRILGKAVTACLGGGAGGVVERTGYQVTIPDGWREATEMLGPGIQSRLARGTFSRSKVDVVLAEPADLAGGFVFVVREPGVPPNFTLRQYFESTSSRGRPDLTTLGGVDALTFEVESAEDSRSQRFVVALRGRVAYFVVFSVDDRHDDNEKRLDALLASWRWK